MRRTWIKFGNILYSAAYIPCPENYPDDSYAPGDEILVAEDALNDVVCAEIEKEPGNWHSEAWLLGEEIDRYLPVEVIGKDEETIARYLVDSY